jgi:hypothetical protein
MRVKWYIFSLLLFIFIILCFNTRLYAAGSNKTIFDDIVTKTGSSIVEYGVTTSFQTSEDGAKVCSLILSNMNLGKEVKSTSFTSESLYRLDFQSGTSSGYVESVPDAGANIIKLHVIRTEDKDNLQELSAKVKKAIVSFYKKPKLFLYLKAKTPEFDNAKTNRTIVSLLKNGGTIDIDTVNLGKSFSTVCYSGRFEPTMISGKLIDFNFAVCSYTSGNYIIMGTPEILETY